MKLPPQLYRGDADLQNKRQLREWRRGYLLTNLSNEGSGKEIFSVPLIESIRRHVDEGWDKTHFLSFTESYSRALYFAGATDKPYVLTDSRNWDAVIITIDTGCFDLQKQYAPGMYKCAYTLIPNLHCGHELSSTLAFQIPRLFAASFRNDKAVSVLLVDVATFLYDRATKGAYNLETAFNKATRDTEWLILPLDPVERIPGENTAALDISCISKFDSLKWCSSKAAP